MRHHLPAVRTSVSTVRVRSCATVVLAVALGLHAPARTQPAGGTEGHGAYIRLFTGVGVTRDSDLVIRQPALGTDLAIRQVSWEHRSLSTAWTRDSIPYMGVRAGLFLPDPRWLSLSLEALHFKILADTTRSVRVTGVDEGAPVDVVAPMDHFVQQYRVTNGVNMFLANALAHRRLGRSARFPGGRTEIYGGLGGGVTVPYTASAIDGASRGQYELGPLAAQLLAGVAWNVSTHWDLSLEYKHTRTTVDGGIAQGDSLSRLRTNHLAFGLGYRFTGPPAAPARARQSAAMRYRNRWPRR
jgi:hypothetical protein